MAEDGDHLVTHGYDKSKGLYLLWKHDHHLAEDEDLLVKDGYGKSKGLCLLWKRDHHFAEDGDRLVKGGYGKSKDADLLWRGPPVPEGGDLRVSEEAQFPNMGVPPIMFSIGKMKS